MLLLLEALLLAAALQQHVQYLLFFFSPAFGSRANSRYSSRAISGFILRDFPARTIKFA